MQFAKRVYVGAGIWGVLILPPLYFLTASVSPQHPSVISDPLFYYAFLTVALAWQFGFFVIGSDPVKYRPMMFPSLIEKFGHVLTVCIVYAEGRTGAGDVVAAVPDLVLGILFVFALAKTAPGRAV
ncbi:MAG TPA: hypothetical protein VL309_03385 [Vicinamibacterales bacterium]|jgi:hypothetical protein|nr:hypothetical protein [Vicinamibacterales bacterium]